MSNHPNSPIPLPSPPPSDGGSYAESDYSERSVQPRYTPQELGALFLDFYKFLTTLHYNESDLKIPPATGWPQITRESSKFANFKSDYTLEVLRHLPYFNEGDPITWFHYKSRLEDYTEIESSRLEFFQSLDADTPLAGKESGSTYYLLVKECLIVEELGGGCGQGPPVAVEDFFERLRELYRTLNLIPGRNRETIEAWHIPEIDRRITEEEVHAQTEEWGTELDIQYIRQVYRDHGWPLTLHWEEASGVIDKWQNEVEEGPRESAWYD
ncbi:hypothetical protein FHETE_4414 [Fusarium heterosporum]|uniref:Uncharacterized protein n=1 Tax=Fusarium heterosporum TaxID=42747 RepID=A0A8H5TLA7_FUSHE|nr:hypothetical protein FHETE_4414 [Fusarium heterosporum]